MFDAFNSGGISLFSIVPILMMIIFAIIIGTIVFRILSYLNDKRKPIVSCSAKVLDKREHFRRTGEHGSSTTYYVTFELDNNERIELRIPHRKIGYVVKGDRGILNFQGKLFVDFAN